MTAETIAQYCHVAVHLAHRWFAFFEASGGDVEAHLTIFHPQAGPSGHRGQHLFAKENQTLVAWFAAVPDTINSHHILRSVYRDMADKGGWLASLVAYQAPADEGVPGSIISYGTQVEFARRDRASPRLARPRSYRTRGRTMRRRGRATAFWRSSMASRAVSAGRTIPRAPR